MKIIFGHNRHWASVLIRFFSWSRWSHVGILDGDYVLEARGGIGIVKTPLSEFKLRYVETCIRQLPGGDIEYARSLVGREFDDRGMWSILFHLPFQDPDKYFCSEYVAEVCPVIDSLYAHKVTPENLFWISAEPQ